MSKLYQHFRERDLPYGLQDSLSTLTSLLVRSYLLRNEIKTRYGWVANPYPTGTFTPQDTPSFAQRDNASHNRREKAERSAAFLGSSTFRVELGDLPVPV